MIYSNEFVWLHFPKCAGTKIEKLFSKYFSDNTEITQDAVGIKNDPLVKWHDTIAKREKRDSNFKLGKKVIIFPIRKLPSWLESRYNFELDRSPHLTDSPEILLEGNYLEQNGSIGSANEALRLFLPEHLIKSNQIEFIRTEHFEEDFKRVFGKYIDVSTIPNAEFSKKANASKNRIPENIKQQLHNPENNLYKFCPYWKMIEDIAYYSNLTQQRSSLKNGFVKDEQADIFRDTAMKAIQEEEWECALKNLQVAHFIKPHGAYIKLQLINVLVQLKKFNEVIPYLDFLNNPPDYVVKNSSLNKLRNKLYVITNSVINN